MAMSKWDREQNENEKLQRARDLGGRLVTRKGISCPNCGEYQKILTDYDSPQKFFDCDNCRESGLLSLQQEMTRRGTLFTVALVD